MLQLKRIKLYLILQHKFTKKENSFSKGSMLKSKEMFSKIFAWSPFIRHTIQEGDSIINKTTD